MWILPSIPSCMHTTWAISGTPSGSTFGAQVPKREGAAFVRSLEQWKWTFSPPQLFPKDLLQLLIRFLMKQLQNQKRSLRTSAENPLRTLTHDLFFQDGSNEDYWITTLLRRTSHGSLLRHLVKPWHQCKPWIIIFVFMISWIALHTVNCEQVFCRKYDEFIICLIDTFMELSV